MLAVSSLLASSSLARAEPATLSEVISTYRAHATVPFPELTPGQLERLEAGKVVKLRTPPQDRVPVGAMGLVLSEQSRPDLWLGSLDPDQSYPDDFLSHDLPVVGAELQRWYGFIELPAPFADRHFAVRTTINTELAAATDGKMWERHWVLDREAHAEMRVKVEAGEVKGLDLELFDKAIYLPANRGSWIFLDLPDGRVLFGYQTASALGGEIPDRLVTRYLFWGLDEIVDGVLERAEAMRGHYVGGHPLLAGGDGALMPTYGGSAGGGAPQSP